MTFLDLLNWMGEHPFLSFFLFWVALYGSAFFTELFMLRIPTSFMQQINIWKHGHQQIVIKGKEEKEDK